MSSLAQEESRSIYENVSWWKRKRMADGKVSLPYSQFLGYEKGEGGLPKAVPTEAEVMRLIFRPLVLCLLQKRERLGKGKTLEGFIRDIKGRPLAITGFDERL